MLSPLLLLFFVSFYFLLCDSSFAILFVSVTFCFILQFPNFYPSFFLSCNVVSVMIAQVLSRAYQPWWWPSHPSNFFKSFHLSLEIIFLICNSSHSICDFHHTLYTFGFPQIMLSFHFTNTKYKKKEEITVTLKLHPMFNWALPPPHQCDQSPHKWPTAAHQSAAVLLGEWQVPPQKLCASQEAMHGPGLQ